MLTWKRSPVVSNSQRVQFLLSLGFSKLPKCAIPIGMGFAPKHQTCWVQNTSRIQKKKKEKPPFY